MKSTLNNLYPAKKHLFQASRLPKLTTTGIHKLAWRLFNLLDSGRAARSYRRCSFPSSFFRRSWNRVWWKAELSLSRRSLERRQPYYAVFEQSYGLQIVCVVTLGGEQPYR